MNRPIRQLVAVICVMFLALAASTTYIQFFQAKSLNANPWNVRALYNQYGTKRGPIIVGGEAIASSEPVNDTYSFQRVYHQGPLYSNLTGYFSTAFNSMTGTEAAMDGVLAGSDDSLAIQRLQELFTGAEPQGGGVELTIDPQLQEAAEKAMDGQRGAVVIADAHTGEILTQYSSPGYDPNVMADHSRSNAEKAFDQLSKDPEKPLVDRATGGDQYAPGSSFKLLTAVAMIENLGLTPDSLVEAPREYSPPGTSHVIYNPGQLACGDGSGQVTLNQAFAQSCNTPFAIGGVQVGAEAMIKQAEKFGFNAPLTTPLPVSASRFPQPEDAAALAMDSFGQRDIRVTPMQMTMIAMAIANDGELMRPHLVKRTLTADLEPISETKPESMGRAMSKDTAHYMQVMMSDEVKNGTGHRAAIEGVDVQGKTGTAEIDANTPPHTWFVANASINGRTYSITVLVENSGHAGWYGDGGSVSAPIAKKILETKLS
ncbi:penicillin-binding transpeptidase domain-containing protein [Actinobaculum suis]|uniref:penicillin-binding transpeptidase domain-containing protein n=1 Tax=Actinobaculum suis TaxID=1657 RepID=UPI0008086897|nr:penicillin-binding transpeptidase domain-containing protein [Actinobaculum suis]OCA95096.1 penicillin-binding protein [Actinobaculum suis]OCA95718.1 penicillin-binding protein [Actinobaculum suis]